MESFVRILAPLAKPSFIMIIFGILYLGEAFAFGVFIFVCLGLHVVTDESGWYDNQRGN